MLVAPMNHRHGGDHGLHAKPYCQCWSKLAPVPWKQLSVCSCGEGNDVSEWKWAQPGSSTTSWVVMSDDHKQVTFHPYYSSGTAIVKGDTPLHLNNHYYWEIKMLTDTYGTDIMVGIGTDKVNVDYQLKFTSLLGLDEESYGLSYRGAIQHNSSVQRESAGFCRGTIVGVRVDMWRGTLEFYLNRKPQGISFHNLRRHQMLFPMICSTAAQSSMRLIYTASWKASLLVDAARTLAASISAHSKPKLPPGLWYRLRKQFWLTLPTEGCISDNEDEDTLVEQVKVNNVLSSGLKRRHWQSCISPQEDVAEPHSALSHPLCLYSDLF